MHPDKIGRYKIKEELGHGEMGAVYRAFDPSFNREVAIKVLPLELMRNLKILARFRRELKMIALLEHPASDVPDCVPCFVPFLRGSGSAPRRD